MKSRDKVCLTKRCYFSGIKKRELGKKLKNEVLDRDYQRTFIAYTITETDSANSFRERVAGLKGSILYDVMGGYIGYIGVKEITEEEPAVSRIVEIAGTGEFKIFGISC